MATASPATGSPVEIGMIVPTNSPVLSVPAIPAAMKAAIAAVNAHGGLLGHKVVLDYCNDQVNPNVAAQCARQLVSDHVIATVSNFTVFGAVTGPILGAAAIPDVGSVPIGAQQYTAANSYLIESGGYGYVFADLLALHQAGHHKIAVAYLNSPGDQQESAAAAAKATGLGMTVVDQIPLSPTLADFDPTINQITQSGADAVILFASTAAEVSFIKSYAALGAKFGIATDQAALTDGDIKQLSTLSSNVFGIILSGTLPPFAATADFPKLTQYDSEMATEAATGDSSAQPAAWQSLGLQAWMDMHVLADIVNKDGSDPVTAASVTSALNSAKNVVTGLTPAWTPSSPGPAQYPRVSNPDVYIMDVENGVLTLTSSTPMNAFS